MKTKKTKLAAILVGLPLLLVAATAALPSRMHVARRVRIDAAPETVLARVADLRRRPDWTAWAADDPGARYTFEGSAGAKGASMRFDGEKMGAATVVIDRFEPARELVTHVHFERPMAMTTSDAFRVVVSDGHSTEIEWAADGDLGWPVGRIFGIFADGAMGPAYERGLARLKSDLETPTAAR